MAEKKEEVSVASEKPKENDAPESSAPAAKKSYIIKNIGGVQDGDWFDFDPEYHKWVEANYPSTYAGILRGIKEQDDADKGPSDAQKTQAEIDALNSERAKVEARAQAAMVKNQTLVSDTSLQHLKENAESQLDAAKKHLERVETANKNKAML